MSACTGSTLSLEAAGKEEGEVEQARTPVGAGQHIAEVLVLKGLHNEILEREYADLLQLCARGTRKHTSLHASMSMSMSIRTASPGPHSESTCEWWLPGETMGMAAVPINSRNNAGVMMARPTLVLHSHAHHFGPLSS